MTISTPFQGSGEFVQEKEWTCSQHSFALRHECDCEHCEREWDCDECATSEWRDLRNEDGSPKMRELSGLEVMLRAQMTRDIKRLSTRISWDEVAPLPRIEWREDDLEGA